MYNRHPTLPIDIKYDLTDPDSDNVESDGEPFDIETFRSVVDSAKSLRENVHQQAGQNIKKAQVKQQKDYNNRHSTPNATLPIGSKVLFNVLARIIYMIIIKCTFCIVYMIIVISEPGLNTPINIYGNDNINAMEISLR